MNKKKINEDRQPENLTKKFDKMKKNNGQITLAVCFGYNTPSGEQIDAEALDKIIRWLDKNAVYPREDGESAYHICLFLNQDNPDKLQADLLKVKDILANHPDKFYSFDTRLLSLKLQAIAPPSWKDKNKKEWDRMYEAFSQLLEKYSKDLEPLIAKDGERFVKVYGKDQQTVRQGIIEETIFLLMQLKSTEHFSPSTNILFHTHNKVFNIMNHLLRSKEPNYCEELGLSAASLEVISLKYAEWKQKNKKQQQLSSLQQSLSNDINNKNICRSEEKGKEKDEPITQDQQQITIKKGETTMRVRESQSTEDVRVKGKEKDGELMQSQSNEPEIEVESDTDSLESPEHSACSTPACSYSGSSDEEGDEERMDTEHDEDFSAEQVEYSGPHSQKERAFTFDSVVTSLAEGITQALLKEVTNQDQTVDRHRHMQTKKINVASEFLAGTIDKLKQAQIQAAKPSPQNRVIRLTQPVPIPTSNSNNLIQKRLSSPSSSPGGSPTEKSFTAPKDECSSVKRRIRSGELPTHAKSLQSCGFHSPKQGTSASSSPILVEGKSNNTENRMGNW